MGRELNNWIDAYIEYTDSSESPLSYHTWSALSVIAGALRRNVYLQWGLGQVIYPNMYIVLVGASGRTRKGSALGIAKEFLKSISSVSVAPESSTGREAMILAMKRANNTYEDPVTKEIKNQCSISAVSEELSVFLGQGNITYLANLTDWYDSKDEWEYESVGRGRDRLVGLCLNLIGGTAPDWLQSMIPAEAVGGGFTSRVIFIVEERKRKSVPKHIMTPRELELRELLIADLERISKMIGPFRMDREAEELYTQWYIDEDTKLSNGQPVIEDPRFAGYCERRATHIRKIMMCCSAARSDDLIITANDFYRAKEFLAQAEVHMGKTFGGLGRARNSDILENIKNFIQRMGISTRKTVLAKFYRDITPLELNQIEDTLKGMGVIKIKVFPLEGDKSYTWINSDD